MEPLWVQKWQCRSPFFFMVEMETELIQQSDTKPREWKRYIDDVFSHWDCDRKVVNRFIKRANYFRPTIKFTAEISDNQITFLDSTVFKGERFEGTTNATWGVRAGLSLFSSESCRRDLTLVSTLFSPLCFNSSSMEDLFLITEGIR